MSTLRRVVHWSAGASLGASLVRRRIVCSFACWHVGALVRWLTHWRVGVLVCWRVGMLVHGMAGACTCWRVSALERRGEEVGRESGLNVIRRQKNAWRQPCASEYRRVHVCWRAGALEVREEAVGSERP